MAPLARIAFICILAQMAYQAESHSLSPAGYGDAGELFHGGVDSGEGALIAERQDIDEAEHSFPAENATSMTKSFNGSTILSALRERRCCCCDCCCCGSGSGSGSGSGEAGVTIGDMIGLASLISRRTAKRMVTYPDAVKIVKRRAILAKRDAVGTWARAGGSLREEGSGSPVATSWSESGRVMPDGTKVTDQRKVISN